MPPNKRKIILPAIPLLLAAVTVPVFAGEPFDPENPPGDFVNLGLHRMYFDCRGNKTPTVLIEVGIGDASANWFDIMQELSGETRTCIYDRAGYGWSDTGPGARTTAQITYELHAVLELAEIPGPYVLVGHSFGGFTARYFSAMYPAETVGAVLVDSSHPEQVTRLSDLDRLERSKQQGRNPVISRRGPPPPHLNEMQKKWYLLNSSRKATFTLMDELKHFSDSAKQVSTTGNLPAIPIAVITRGKRLLPEYNGRSLEDVWRNMQRELLELSPNSWQVIAENSGHNIHRDEPETIISTVLDVIHLAREDMQKESAYGSQH